MHILVACDSFKDALPSAEVCGAVVKGLARAHPDWTATAFPLADGGEGCLPVLASQMGLDLAWAEVADALGRPIRAPLGLTRDRRLAVVEMASAAGLQGLTEIERDPLLTSTFGVGQLLAAAADLGAKEIILGIGGSATTDAGIGAAAALGWRFLDGAGRAVESVGGRMLDIARILPPSEPFAPELEVLCDVTNPLFGPDGAAWVYGRQKGASDAGLERLDSGLRHVADVLQRPDLAKRPGAGAAGGLGFGAMAFLGARLVSGVDRVMDLTGFDAAVAAADLVITGEGRIDGQTLNGKLIGGVCARARAAGKPVVALCGSLSATTGQIRSMGLKAAYQINDSSLPLQQSLLRTAQDLEITAAALSV